MDNSNHIVRIQGQSRALTSEQNLEISDENNLPEVKVRVLRGTQHGTLTMGGKDFFTPADLDAGLVVYTHDGSNTYRYNALIKVTARRTRDQNHDGIPFCSAKLGDTNLSGSLNPVTCVLFRAVAFKSFVIVLIT